MNARPRIEVRGLHKAYGSAAAALPVLGGVDLALADGEFVAIVGPSGCGKSTLLNVLAGFEQPDAGSVQVNGRALDGPGRDAVVISQHGSVFPWLTVQQNLMFGLHALAPAKRAALADRYAALVGLQGFERSYPHELSGGMLKRVELARALVVKPQILYMDEPFSALDALTGMRLREELLRILAVERHTVLLITHDVEEAVALADRILVLSPRPARVRAAFDVALPHPRRLADPRALALRAAVLRELGVPGFAQPDEVQFVAKQ